MQLAEIILNTKKVVRLFLNQFLKYKKVYFNKKLIKHHANFNCEVVILTN